MKELKKLDTIYLETYDVHVNSYLTYAQIQQIVNSLSKLESWAEKMQNIDMLVLYHATDIGQEELEKHDFDYFYESGLIEVVKKNILNYYLIDIAINYNESWVRIAEALNKQAPALIDKMQKVIDKYAVHKK